MSVPGPTTRRWPCCRLRLAADEIGLQEAVDYSADLMEQQMEAGDTEPIQMTLWTEDGYRCLEFLRLGSRGAPPAVLSEMGVRRVGQKGER